MGGRLDHCPSDKSACGSEVKRCVECSRSARLTKETIRNGLKIIRVRYGLPYSELPDLEVSELSRFLLFLLLTGKERTPVKFPQRQVPGEDKDGCIRTMRLGRRDRWEFAHSVNSLKRNLPRGCARHTPSVRGEWEGLACSEPDPPDPEYVLFVRGIVTQLFPSGWDRNYASYVGSHLPNPSARKPRMSRADHLWLGRRGEFFELATRDLPESLGDSLGLSGRYKEVLSAGKNRPMLIFDELIDLLGPLHKMMFDHLARSTDWLLVGPPTAKRIKSVCRNRVQTSVDLVSATDGLSRVVTDAILDSLFFTSWKVPRWLRSFSKSSYRPVFRSEDGSEKRVSVGTMMGGYLSFVLLCLHSYCAARWAARFDVDARFLVNGDDAVISASRAIAVVDYPKGYRLNDNKSIRAENVVEVNSTVFLRSGDKWLEVRHLRRGGATTDYPGMLHMASAVLKAGARWVDAFWRARIGSRWGFLPSQVGHSSYASYLRERGLLRFRYRTRLPEPDDQEDDEGLRRIFGRDPTAIEAELLRSFFWMHGRKGGLKRDVFSPSIGKVRRSYGRTSGPRWSYVSFNVWWRCISAERGVLDGHPSPGSAIVRAARRRKRVWFFLPEDCYTAEEERGLLELVKWHVVGDHCAQAQEGLA